MHVIYSSCKQYSGAINMRRADEPSSFQHPLILTTCACIWCNVVYWVMIVSTWAYFSCMHVYMYNTKCMYTRMEGIACNKRGS